MKKQNSSYLVKVIITTALAVGVFGLFGIQTTFAATAKKVTPPKLEISGWVPYWRSATGTKEALDNLSVFQEINPFGYTVKTNGTLFDAMKVSEEPWASFVATAKAKKIRVVPTVMWSNGTAIHKILSNTKTRIALEDEIVATVKKNGFDGIDIDFEGKLAETKPYFSTFLKGLYMRMGNKWVMCTIEARTPLDSRYDTIPKGIEYANDFVAINKYCDRVRFMAYDQGAIDVKLNREANGQPYVPIADTRWVEKTIKEALKTIPAKKISIGVATYGYEYEVVPLSEYGYRYKMKWAFNPRYATELASTLGVTPQRNAAGELSFTYNPNATTELIHEQASSTIEAVSPVGNNQLAALGMMSGTIRNPATSTQTTIKKETTHIVWWSDSQAIQDKIDLAKKLGVRGISIFKVDGGADPKLWEILAQ
jgi:spore germination protein YaaH